MQGSLSPEREPLFWQPLANAHGIAWSDGRLTKVTRVLLIASGPVVLLTWLVQCYLNSQSFHDRVHGAVHHPVRPWFFIGGILLALLPLVPPDRERAPAPWPARALLFMRFLVGSLITVGELVSSWQSYDSESRAYQAFVVCVFVSNLATAYPCRLGREVPGRTIWWSLRTMPTAVACCSMATSVGLYVSTGGAATSYPAAPLGGLVYPTLSSSFIFFCMPILAIVAAFAPHRRVIVYRWYTRACREKVRGHGATILHVDSICAICTEFLATHILKPCDLGVCPGCFSEIVPRGVVKDTATAAERAAVSCPQCYEHVRRWVRIRHVDLHDDRDV